MKTIIVLLLSVLMIATTLFAQYDGWEEQILPFENGMINRLSFTDENSGWARGMDGDQNYAGIVLRTTDGGINWNPVDFSNTDFEPTTLWATDKNTCYAAGRNNNSSSTDFEKIMILKTIDGGTSWSEQNVPAINGELNDITFTSGTVGITVGRNSDNNQVLIIFTTDGTNWQQASHPAEDFIGSKVYFTDNNNGWVAAFHPNQWNTPGLFRTTDGGANWSKLTHPITNGHFNDVCFINENIGWVAGAQLLSSTSVGFLLYTNDGGTSWSDVDLDIPVDDTGTTMKVTEFGEINTYNFYPEQIDGIYRGMLAAYKSENSEFTVVSQITYTDNVYNIFNQTNFDNHFLWAYQFGVSNQGNGKISSALTYNNLDRQKVVKDTANIIFTTFIKGTKDGPIPVVRKKVARQLASLSVSPANVALYPGQQHQFKATGYDAGMQTVSIPNPVWGTTGGGTIAPNGQSCTFTATTIGTYQIKCTDYSSSISDTANLTISNDALLVSINVTPSAVTMQVGDPPVTFKATGYDAGMQTVSIPNPVWGTTGGGTIAPNGQSCTFTATTAGTYQIKCTDYSSSISDTANLTISNDALLVSINVTPSAVTMQVGDPPFTFNAISRDGSGNTIQITNPQWTVSGGGTIVPNGQSCAITPMTPGTWQIACQDGGSGISDTAKVTISTGLETIVNTNIPRGFNLHQNYPNPFNPTTTISYELPKGTVVKIDIIDFQGKIVNTLYNDYKEQGSNSIKWNGYDNKNSLVGSGIYFYRVQAGDFSETKKMVLVK